MAQQVYKLNAICDNCFSRQVVVLPTGVRFTAADEEDNVLLPSGYIHPTQTEYDPQSQKEVAKFIQLDCRDCGVAELIRDFPHGDD